MSHIFDVAIMGAGPSGIAAAINAAKNGVKTVLIEKDSIIGGSALKAQVHTVEGIVDSSNKEFLDGILKKAWNRSIFHPEELVDRYYELLHKSGAQILCDHEVISVDTKDNNINSIMCITPSGKKVISAKIFIDASGISIFEHLTGNNDFTGEKRCYMTAFIGKVETVGGRCYSDQAQKLLQDKIIQAKSKNILDNDVGVKILPTIRGDIALLIVSHSDTEDNMGQFMRLQTQKAMSFLQTFGFGFENASIIGTTKNLFYDVLNTSKAKYILSYDDIKEHKLFDNYVVSNAYFDSHHSNENINNDKPFLIPYDALLSSIYKNLLLCGKNIGAHSNVFTLINGMSLHLATGKAAGIAASIASKRNINLDKVVAYEIQAEIEDKYYEFKNKHQSNDSDQPSESNDKEFVENIAEWEKQYESPLHQAKISLNRNGHSKTSNVDSFDVLDKALGLIDDKEDAEKETNTESFEEIQNNIEQKENDNIAQEDSFLDINNILNIGNEIINKDDDDEHDAEKSSTQSIEDIKSLDIDDSAYVKAQKDNINENIDQEEDFEDRPSDIEDRPSDIEDRPSDIEDRPSEDDEEDDNTKDSNVYGRFYDDMYSINSQVDEKDKENVFKEDNKNIITQSNDVMAMLYSDDEKIENVDVKNDENQKTDTTKLAFEDKSKLSSDISFMEQFADKDESLLNDNDYYTVLESQGNKDSDTKKDDININVYDIKEDTNNIESKKIKEDPRTYLMPSELLGGLPHFEDTNKSDNTIEKQDKNTEANPIDDGDKS